MNYRQRTTKCHCGNTLYTPTYDGEGSKVWECTNCFAMTPRRENQRKAGTTKSQEAAVAYFRRFLQERCDSDNERQPTWNTQITEFNVKNVDDRFQSLSAQVERTGLPEGNYLRALDHDYWHVFVGRHGHLTVVGCPKSFEQFKGRTVFGMKFKKV